MKKVLKTLTLVLFVGVFALFLASCSNVSQSYADKINDAAKNEQWITYEDAKDALGDECVDAVLFNNGVLVAYKGYNADEFAELEKKMEAMSDDELKDFVSDLEAIVIVVENGKCTSAQYAKGEDMLKD